MYFRDNLKSALRNSTGILASLLKRERGHIVHNPRFNQDVSQVYQELACISERIKVDNLISLI